MRYLFLCYEDFKHGPLMYFPLIRDLEEYIGRIEIVNDIYEFDAREDDIVLIGSRDEDRRVRKGVTFLLDHIVLPSNGIDFFKADYEVVSSPSVARLYEDLDIAPRVRCYPLGYFRFDSLDMSKIERDTAFVYFRGIRGLTLHDEWAIDKKGIELILRILAERFKQVYAVYHLFHADNPKVKTAKNVQWINQEDEWNYAFGTSEYMFGDYTSMFCMAVYDSRRKVFRYDYSFKLENKAAAYFHRMLNECVYPFTENNLKYVLDEVSVNDSKKISRIEWSSRLYGMRREKVAPKIGKVLLELGEYYRYNYEWK